jgi:hypothetical protein
MANPPRPAPQQLVPVKALWCGPADLGGADSSEGCFCGDAGGYVIKKNIAGNPTASHCEWLCSRLAQRAGVPVAGFNIVETTSGELWFGSEWAKGSIKDWWTSVASGGINIDDLRDGLSQIYALDLFTGNGDRHLNNYLVFAEGASHRVHSMDYGRAWLFNGLPLPALPMAATENTMEAKRWMKDNFAAYPNAAAMVPVVDELSRVTTADVAELIRQQPMGWLDQTQVDAILAWWDAGNARQRIDQIRDGIGDGSLI